MRIKELELIVNKIKKENKIKFNSLFGYPIIVNRHLPKDTILFVDNKETILKVVNLGNRKVLFRIGRFELAYYEKEEL